MELVQGAVIRKTNEVWSNRTIHYRHHLPH